MMRHRQYEINLVGLLCLLIQPSKATLALLDSALIGVSEPFCNLTGILLPFAICADLEQAVMLRELRGDGRSVSAWQIHSHSVVSGVKLRLGG